MPFVTIQSTHFSQLLTVLNHSAALRWGKKITLFSPFLGSDEKLFNNTFTIFSTILLTSYNNLYLILFFYIYIFYI